MAPSTETVAREIAVGFYTHLLAGRFVAQALFLARVSREAVDEGTPLFFAMAGYPDSCITDAGVSSAENPPHSKERRPPRAARRQRRL
jgi:hypothetical protein